MTLVCLMFAPVGISICFFVPSPPPNDLELPVLKSRVESCFIHSEVPFAKKYLGE